MIDVAQYSGKEFGIILVDYSVKREGDWIVVRGVGKVKDGRLFVDRGTEIDFPIPDDTYDRIRPASADISGIVRGAEFIVMLTVGAAP